MKSIKPTRGDRVFLAIDTVFLLAALLLVLYPLYFVVIASFSDPTAVAGGETFFWVKGFQMRGYQLVLSDADVLVGYKNTVLYTVLGTLISLFMTLTAGYALTVDFAGRKFVNLLFTFTMFFGGGMIPGYFLIRDLGMLDTIWAMVIPGSLSVYNLMVARTFISGNIPVSLYEAAQIDGSSRIGFFVRIVLPLSGVLIAILALFYGVGYWNSYMSAILYITDRKLFPLQLVLRETLILNQSAEADVLSQNPEMIAEKQRVADSMKYSLIIVSSLPVLMLYPFLQRYFIGGVLIGSVKE